MEYWALAWGTFGDRPGWSLREPGHQLGREDEHLSPYLHRPRLPGSIPCEGSFLAEKTGRSWHEEPRLRDSVDMMPIT